MTARPADMSTLELERMCHITSTVSSAEPALISRTT